MSSIKEKEEEEYILKSFAEARKDCTVPSVLNYSRQLGNTGLRLHRILMIVGGVAAIINIVIAIYLLASHVRNWTRPREQKQHLRIIFFVIFLSLTTFFSLAFYNASGFIQPIGQYYEGFAIVALYLLYCNLTTAEHPTQFVKYHHVYSELAAQDDKNKKPTWLSRSWPLVFQILITRIATFVAAEVLFDTKCPLSKARTQGTLATTVIQSVSTGFAIAGVIGYERRTRKRHLQEHDPTLKLFAFKGVVGLQATQEIIFSALGESKVFFPTAPFYISYNDFTKGFPAIIFLWELTIVACLFLKAFSANRYKGMIRDGAPKAAGPLKAFFSLWDARDFFVAFGSYFTSKSKEPSNETSGNAGAETKMLPQEEL